MYEKEKIVLKTEFETLIDIQKQIECTSKTLDILTLDILENDDIMAIINCAMACLNYTSEQLNKVINDIDDR